MIKNNFRETEDLYYSTVYGGGVYKWDRQAFVQDPLGGYNGEKLFAPLLTNPITGEAYFVKRMNCNYLLNNKLRGRILNPPDRSNILWPSDMVNLSDEQAAQCSLFVAQEYKETPTPVNEKKGNRALLFPYSGYPTMINGISKLAQIKQLNWKNPEIRNIAVQILQAIDNINKDGYVYEDIHLSRFFFRPDGTVYLNFSNLVYSFDDFISDADTVFCHAKKGEYPIEFAEPALVRGIQKSFDFNTQNYSLCALLFYLFFGQYCYDGRLLTGYIDDSIQKHYVKFRDYHKMPIFIFDLQDKKNALGAFDEENKVIKLWEECPKILQDLFILTLSQSNAERRGKFINPPPSTWLRCLNQLGWITEKKTILESIQQDVAEYADFCLAPVSDLGSILKSLVTKHSYEMYFDDKQLQSALHELGAAPSDIYKVCLMTKVTGFRNLMECDLRTQQIDLDRFVQNAVKETGFNRTTVMELTSDIALSADIACDCTIEHLTSNLLTETAFVVPASLYESEIKEFSDIFEKSVFKGEDVTKLDFSKLQPLVAAGIPKAKFYLGYCLLKGIQFEVDNVRAISLLQEAADAGDAQASAALGDYYYDNGVSDWGKAYEYYTGYGSLALNEKRKDAIVSIFNQKEFNRITIKLSIVLFMAIVALLIFAPGASLYAAHRIIGSIFTLLSFAILIMAIHRHRIKPYDSMYFLPVGMFTMWFFYMVFRFLF